MGGPCTETFTSSILSTSVNSHLERRRKDLGCVAVRQEESKLLAGPVLKLPTQDYGLPV